ncbi:uncharacterized protein CC84DRAFT_1176709 [Paraphaeosphaeria sporulosa]|uniref:Uncharacterized protein n=1 Tax=Paraphaeosphaeria sporulosa TaxID=1460663 RepID=A0A177CCJ4_9PLEO|nr:uncharacterized protein CC84DRAFT_1176709 [Paraphaeosphaeria sporulosa]OAG04498.1 hypothetical protein CC84DRAFT_1176709 [Paraphaeosphaeria sporulosa]
MQFTIATISALFAATSCALPAAQGATATVSFINDQTGAHAPVVAPLDGTVINLYNVLIGTPVGVPNQVIASSAQLIDYPQNVDCTINGINGGQLGQLNARQTYVLLKSGGINLDGATMMCTPLLL